MTIPYTTDRYRAFSMEFTAHLDDKYVEMNISTDKERPITIICDKSSVLSMQSYIRDMVNTRLKRISTWGQYEDSTGFQDNAAGS